MVKSELMVIAKTLEELVGVSGSIRFKYAVSKNIKKISEDVSAIEKVRGEVINGFEEKRIELCQKYADKDENGEAKTENEQFVGLVGNEEFESAMKELNDEFKPKFLELEEFLNSEVDVDWYKIKLDDIPESVKTIQLIVIDPLIVE